MHFSYDVVAGDSADSLIPPWAEKFMPAVVRDLDPGIAARLPKAEWLFEPNMALLERYGVAAARARYSDISPNIFLQVCNATMDSFVPTPGTVLGTIVEMQDIGAVDIITDPVAYVQEQGRYSYTVQTDHSKNGWRPRPAAADPLP